MELSSSDHRPLARAYLALADDPDPAAGQHTIPRTVVALAAAIALAFAAPLAWASAVPRDTPAATVVKAAATEEDDGDGS